MISMAAINTILDDGGIPTKNDLISVVAYHRPIIVVSFRALTYPFLFVKNDISMKQFITIMTESPAYAF